MIDISDFFPVLSPHSMLLTGAATHWLPIPHLLWLSVPYCSALLVFAPIVLFIPSGAQSPTARQIDCCSSALMHHDATVIPSHLCLGTTHDASFDAMSKHVLLSACMHR